MLREGWTGRRAAGFTLQWHLTNACGGACRHCYDRSERRILRLPEMLPILDDLGAFAGGHGVRAGVSFTGGDPFLHPDFWALWEAAAARQLRASILGNPVPAATLDRLLAIQAPAVYQVSLEGLEEQDEAVRGAGHFARTIAFLEAARARGLTTHVMLTLTSDNVGDALPLAGRLRGLADRVSFNRLARTGDGAALAHPDAGALHAFLDGWVAAARRERHVGLKDNLLHAARRRAGLAPFRGCTGHGCGAAFDFVALLPDGEVHACRKFASPIGTMPGQRLGEIWRSPAARRYRAGSAACRGCALRRRCGGCLAVTAGEGLDPLAARDPHCPGPVAGGTRLLAPVRRALRLGRRAPIA